MACRDSVFVPNPLLLYLSCYLSFPLLPISYLSTLHVSVCLSLSLSQSQSQGVISLHSLSEGHMYFHRWSAFSCLPHLSGELLNSRRQQVLMKLWKEEDQGDVNASVVGRCWALSSQGGGRCSTQGHGSWVNANANLLKFNFKCSLQKHLAWNIFRGECPLTDTENSEWIINW